MLRSYEYSKYANLAQFEKVYAPYGTGEDVGVCRFQLQLE